MRQGRTGQKRVALMKPTTIDALVIANTSLMLEDAKNGDAGDGARRQRAQPGWSKQPQRQRHDDHRAEQKQRPHMRTMVSPPRLFGHYRHYVIDDSEDSSAR